jgi:hypothetical protein
MDYPDLASSPDDKRFVIKGIYQQYAFAGKGGVLLSKWKPDAYK